MNKYKLLVTTPSGKQEVVEVEESGLYFDPQRVMWDERTDGALPAVVLGKMQRNGNQLNTIAETLPAHAAAIRAETVPKVITIRQCELALINAGLLAQVETFISTQSDDFKAHWRRSIEVRRDHPMVSAVQVELDKTDEEIDDLFILAASFE